MEVQMNNDQLITGLHRYVNAGEPLTVKRYIRLMSYLSGMSVQDIATEQKVSRQAVDKSVKEDLGLLEDWIDETYGKEKTLLQ